MGPYELKTSLFDNGDADKFLLFIRNLNMTIEAPGAFKAGAKIQYLITLVHGEALPQFDALYAEVGSATLENLTSIILGLGT